MTSQDVHAEEPDLASLGALPADRTRAATCLALLDGRAWTASEVAGLAGIAPSTATSHLNRLVAGGLLTRERKGRHRSARRADPGVAEMIEALAARAPRRLVPVRSSPPPAGTGPSASPASATTTSAARSPWR